MSQTIQVRVLLFAALAEAAGTNELALPLNPPATAGTALDAVVQAHPALEALASSIALAVNAAYAHRGTPLGDGDTLALIPPVSGG